MTLRHALDRREDSVHQQTGTARANRFRHALIISAVLGFFLGNGSIEQALAQVRSQMDTRYAFQVVGNLGSVTDEDIRFIKVYTRNNFRYGLYQVSYDGKLLYEVDVPQLEYLSGGRNLDSYELGYDLYKIKEYYVENDRITITYSTEGEIAPDVIFTRYATREEVKDNEFVKTILNIVPWYYLICQRKDLFSIKCYNIEWKGHNG